MRMLWILFLAMGAVCPCSEATRKKTIKPRSTGGYYPALSQATWLNQEPFTIWQDKDLYRNVGDLSVREEDINNAIYMNDKDPCRGTTLMNKVMNREPIKMVVIGGSNSAGGGIKDHTRLFHQLFSQWWSQVISPNTGSTLTVENLSLGGTGSDFFTFCLQNFISKNDEPDIVLIELSVNDYGYLHGKTARPMELLTRRLLSLSSFPLLLYVSLVDLVKKSASYSSIKNPRCHNLEDLGQRELASHYGIPLFSWRDILCPINPVSHIRKPYIRPGMVNRDHLHIDVKGHAQVALMIIRYFQNVLQRTGQPYCTKSAMQQPLFADTSILVTNPLCWASTNPGWGKFTVQQSFKVKVQRKRGFSEIPLKSIKAKMGFPSDLRTDAFGGWVSSRAGSFIEYSFQVPPNKWSVGIVLRRMRQNAGQVRMWLDKNKKKAVAITGKAFGSVHFQTRVYFVASDVSPGHHTITLETKGQKTISLLINGIVLGPAGIDGFQGYKPTGTLEKVWSPEDYKKFKYIPNK
ncbi:uncharacterized protein LOC144650087 [Oculina patagonica]